MAEHQAKQGSAQRLLNRALWMQALDELEQEYSAYRKRSSSPVPGASAHSKVAQKGTNVPKQLILNLGGKSMRVLTQATVGIDPRRLFTRT
jgi:hypothetical protein